MSVLGGSAGISVNTPGGGGGSGSGTVTSVALTMPTGVFDIAGSPITESGTLAVTFDTQTANTGFFGPTSGGAATPAFRALVAADIPSGVWTKKVIGAAFTNSGSVLAAANSLPFVCPTAGTITAWNMSLTPSGTGTVKVWKVASGTAIPTVSNSINTSGVAISSGTSVHSTTLTDFTTTAVAANDIFIISLTGVTGSPTGLTFTLEIS